MALILLGCEAQSTPIASISTPTEEIPQVTSAPVVSIADFRYGIVGNLASFVINSDENIDFEVLDSANNLDDFDIVVAYGIYDSWQQSPQSHRASIAINPALAPLDNQMIRDLMSQIIDAQVLVDTVGIDGTQTLNTNIPEPAGVARTILANEGYPDGVQLVLATDVYFAMDSLVSQFLARSIALRLINLEDSVFSENQAHLALFLWTQDSGRDLWVSQVGAENIIDLWTIPISYTSSSELTLSFTENGLPIPPQ